MLRLSKKQDYAILFLTYMSTRQGIETSARQIADHFNLSLPYISKILKELTNHDLIKSERGARGGYSLNVSPCSINIADILKALDEPFALTRCSVGSEENSCEVISQCYIQAPMQALNNKINEMLESTTLADLQSMATN